MAHSNIGKYLNTDSFKSFEKSLKELCVKEDSDKYDQTREELRLNRESLRTKYLNDLENINIPDSPLPDLLLHEQSTNVCFSYDNFINNIPAEYDSNKLKNLIEGHCDLLKSSKSNLKKKVPKSVDTFDTSKSHTSSFDIDLSFDTSNALKSIEEELNISKTKSEKFNKQFSNVELIQNNQQPDNTNNSLCDTIDDVSQQLGSLRQMYENFEDIATVAQKLNERKISDNKSKNPVFKELVTEVVVEMESVLSKLSK